MKFRSCSQTNKTTRKLLKDKTEKKDTSRRKEERNREEVSDKIVLVAELNLPIPHLSVQPEKSYVKSVEKRALPEVLQIQAQTNSSSLAANSLCAFYIPVLLCLNHIR